VNLHDNRRSWEPASHDPGITIADRIAPFRFALKREPEEPLDVIIRVSDVPKATKTSWVAPSCRARLMTSVHQRRLWIAPAAVWCDA